LTTSAGFQHSELMEMQRILTAPHINSTRLWERHRAIAQIGATGRGGVNRQALTPEDAEARRLVLSWSEARNYSTTIDAIGNLFIRRPGTHPELAPVMTGSHLDTQPTGGNFDGVFGVLAGLEVFESLDDAGFVTKRPIELVIWMNEEGSRFTPATMGSAVCSGAIPLSNALETTDSNGTTVRDALSKHLTQLPKLEKRNLGTKGFAFVEAHIEQGPILEATGCQIGVVTGIQGLCIYEVEVVGFEAHAGTTPLSNRRDALVAAVDLIGKLQDEFQDPADVLRFTVGKFEVAPGSPNTVPGRVNFTIDLRHPNAEVLGRVGDAVMRICAGEIKRCSVTARPMLQSKPVEFHPQIIDIVRSAAVRRHLRHMNLVSGATHDSKFMSAQTPTAMIFVPCEKGISHNEAENVRKEDLFAGTQVLCDALVALLDTEI
jgi:beta-ureidopropionase / N-carbamoyl-L-amino-acid hydrolase